MNPRSSASLTPPAPMQTWQEYLDKFIREASTQGFADYIHKLQAHSRAKDFPIELNQFAPLHIIVLFQSLSRAVLLACLQPPPSDVQPALVRVLAAAEAAHYGRTLQGRATTKENQAYQRVREFIPGQLRIGSVVLQAVFACYVQGDYDATRDANELMREARNLAEQGNPAAALACIGQAGAVALRTQIIWQGWSDEGDKTFRDWASNLHLILECLQNVVPLADVETERQHADRIVAAFATDKPEREPWKPPEPEEALALVMLAAREQPFTDDEIRQMGAAYDRQLEIAKAMFDGRLSSDHPGRQEADFARTKEVAVSLAIAALGILRCQDKAVAEQLIGVIVNDCADDDRLDDPPTLKRASQTLGQMGQVAMPFCIAFLRYSNHPQARLWVARALGVAGRGNEEAFQTLLALSERTELKNGKISHLGALAKLHDARAIPLVADVLQALSGPDVIQLSDLYEDTFLLEEDQFELMDALHELNAIEALDPEPNTNRYLDENDDDPGAVIVRGYGRIARAVPANWDYPNKRADDEEDDEEDADDEEDFDEYEDDADPPFLFTPPPKLQPIVNANKTGRNEPCPCGSGKKYKHCHGKDA